MRASAGQSSFRRERRLGSLLEQAQRHVEGLKAGREAPARAERTAAQTAARERAARERVERIEKAMVALEDVKKVKAGHNGKKKDHPPRASTTDGEARVMKMPDGGFRPAYNVQLAMDTESRAVVKLDQIERAEQIGVKMYSPPQASKSGIEPCTVRPGDSEEIAAWRRRMASEAGKTIYKERASTIETVNADLRTYRGVSRFLVRGLHKARCVVLWSALAYNLMHFGRVLLS